MSGSDKQADVLCSIKGMSGNSKKVTCFVNKMDFW